MGRWLSLDPLQSKYPSLSAYNFCANSPLIFVDKDGRDIGIYDKASKSYIEYKPQMKTSSSYDVFTNQTISALNFIHSQGGDGKKTVNFLSSTTMYHTKINETSYGAQHSFDFNGGSNTSTVDFNAFKGEIYNTPNSKTGEKRVAPAGELFHELIHAYLRQYAYVLDAEAIAKFENKEITKAQFNSIRKKIDKMLEMAINEEDIIKNYETVLNEKAGWGTRKGKDVHEKGSLGVFAADCSTCTTGSKGIEGKNLSKEQYDEARNKAEDKK